MAITLTRDEVTALIIKQFGDGSEIRYMEFAYDGGGNVENFSPFDYVEISRPGESDRYATSAQRPGWLRYSDELTAAQKSKAIDILKVEKEEK